MKNRWGIIALLILLFGIVLLFLFGKDPEKNPSIQHSASQQKDTLHSNGDTTTTSLIPSPDSLSDVKEQVNPANSTSNIIKGQNITFKVAGVLKSGEVNWKEGARFQFNDFICKIDETKLFIQIADRKDRLIEVGRGLMQDIFKDNPQRAQVWDTYFSSIDQGSRMITFPIVEDKEEVDLLAGHGIEKLHLEIVSLENQIEDYYFLAPFDGKIVSIRKNIGSRVEKGEVVMVIQEEF